MRNKTERAFDFAGKSGFYDGVITGTGLFGSLVSNLVWEMDKHKDLEYQKLATQPIPKDFNGKMLEVPVGTGILTMPIYRKLTSADITCLDYSEKMMARAILCTASASILFISKRGLKMNIIAHTMEYNGGIITSNLKLRNYMDYNYTEYKRIYNECFYEMRKALGLRPIECCGSKEELSEKSSQIFILEKDSALIGSVAVYENEIDDLIVAKDFQRQGYGEKLLRFAVHHMQANNSYPILLHVADWNKNAMQLYLKNNFVIIKTEVV